MIEKLKRFTINYYNSILYSAISTWLAYTLIKVGHVGIGALLFTVVVIKIIGLVSQNSKLRQFGVIGLNIIWAISTYVFITNHQTVELAYQFPLFILLVGLGIALRGRFNE